MWFRVSKLGKNTLSTWHCHAVPAATVTMINTEKDAMANGKHVFEGPLYDQAGTLRVKEGEVPSDGDLWGMDWLLQGIVGTTKTL